MLQNAIISGLDHLVPNSAAAQFCDGMTANIALSCIGAVFTLLWLWWVFYSVRTLRKFEKTTKADGEEVLIVREKVWRKSMARLLRRDEDDDVNGIKRIVTGGLLDLAELESRNGVNRMRSVNRAPVTGAGNVTANRTLAMGPGLGLGPTTPRPSHESDRSSAAGPGRPGTPTSSPGFGERRDTEAILQSLPQRRGDMPPPPYMGQPQSEGTNTHTLSSSGEGTSTSQESPGSNQALLASGSGSGYYGSSTRPLPLAPPEVDRVVERKMDEMATRSSTGTGTGTGAGTETMDAFTATRLGLGPAAQPELKGLPTASQPRSSPGTGTVRLEDLVDQKLDTYSARANSPEARQATAGPSGSGSGGYETMEQLVDRKIALGDGTATAPSSSSTARYPGSSTYFQAPPLADRATQRYSSEFTTSPVHMHPPENTSTWPGSNPPPHFSASTPSPSPPPFAYRGKGKAAEAGFSLDEPDSYGSHPASASASASDQDMTLEEMIERKMAAMRASKSTEPHRPVPVATRSGESETRRKSKGERKGRARAGSDPGPKLQKHDETDEDDSGDG